MNNKDYEKNTSTIVQKDRRVEDKHGSSPNFQEKYWKRKNLQKDLSVEDKHGSSSNFLEARQAKSIYYPTIRSVEGPPETLPLGSVSERECPSMRV